MSNLTLTAGTARVDITPPVGFRLQGFMRRIEPSQGVESHLLATVLVLADEETKVVIIDCDLIGLDMELVREIRQAVAKRAGTSVTNVTISCTHTHNGPSTLRGVLAGPHDLQDDPREIAALNAYIEDLVGQITGAVALANSKCRPARAVGGCGQASVAINREELNDDGRVLVGRNPSGVTDHSVDVLRVDDLKANPIASIVSYAAHPVVMGYETYQISQDYPGVVRRIVEQETGATCLFLTGAAGNQATLEFLQSDWGEQERIGGIIGCEAAKTFFSIETRPHEVIRELGASLSNIALYHKEFYDGPTHSIFKGTSREVSVPLQSLPPLEKIQADLAESSAHLQHLKDRGAPTTQTVPAQLAKRWAEGVLEKVKAGIKREALSFEIVGYRLDDFVLVGMPGEPFVEIGIGVKKVSKAAHTMFAGYSNGNLAYWPSAETVARGGMSVESAVKTYNISAPPVSETVDILVGEFSQLLKSLDL